jgi:hypothetical protein
MTGKEEPHKIKSTRTETHHSVHPFFLSIASLIAQSTTPSSELIGVGFKLERQ